METVTMGARMPAELIFGLFVYVRLLQLSIDRAGANVQQELRDYFESEGIPPPNEVVSRLAALDAIPRASLLRVLLERLRVLSGSELREWCLSGKEVGRIQSALTSAARLFDIADCEAPRQRNAIRLAVARLEADLEKRLPSKLVRQGQQVAHLNHSGDLQLRRFQQIVRPDWLN